MDVLRELERICFDDYLDDEQLKKLLDFPHTVTYVQKIGEKAVGYAIFVLFKKSIQIVSLGVIPEFRRMGIGTSILEHIKKFTNKHRRRIYFTLDEDAISNIGVLFLMNANFKKYDTELKHLKIFKYKD